MQPYTSLISGEDAGDTIASKLAIAWLLTKLTMEEQDILYLWLIEELNFTEIGKIIGNKYRDGPLTGSAIRYHKDRCKIKLQQYREAIYDR